jgi:hypothetical protein
MTKTQSRHTDDDAALLRSLVLTLRLSQRRRVFAPRVQIGDPPNTWVSFEFVSPAVPDFAIRCDVVGTLLERTERPTMVWMTRSGRPDESSDEDLSWLAATQAAFREAAVPLARFVIVTRYGWLDPRSGATRTWRRLRDR